jgi:hypothetical protein
MSSLVASSLPRTAALGIFLAPLALLSMFAAIKFGVPQTYEAIIQEDHILENLQFVLYASAAVAGFLAAGQFRLLTMRWRAAIWYLFALGILLIAFEEVSWFERVTQLHIDAIVARNTQHEMNIHNLDVVGPWLIVSYMVVGAAGAFGWLLKRNSLILPEGLLCLYFLPTLLMYFYFRVSLLAATHFGNKLLIVGNLMVWRDQEPIETLLALGFFLHAALTYRYARSLSGNRPDHANTTTLTSNTAA